MAIYGSILSMSMSRSFSNRLPWSPMGLPWVSHGSHPCRVARRCSALTAAAAAARAASALASSRSMLVASSALGSWGCAARGDSLPDFHDDLFMVIFKHFSLSHN